MIGRVVHYRDRRILIFCGERSHDQHPVYGAVDNGAAAGEEAEARTYQSNKFHEAESAVTLGASNEGHITSAAKLPDIENELSLRQSVEATAYVNVYASVGGGILIDSSADTMKTISVFSEAGSGIATSEDIETIKTSIVKLAESDEVIAVGGNSEGFVTSHHNEAETESGMSTRQSAEAVVRSANIIYAGDYESKPSILISDLEALDIENIPFYEDYYGEIFVYNELIVDPSDAEVWGMIVEEYVLQRIAEEEILDDPPTIFRWRIENENQRFTVTADTTVTAEQYEIFNRYFQLVNGN